MEWIGDPLIGRGVREQGFRVECGGRTVPGLLWTTGSGGEGRPLVLLGHGGSSHKWTDYILSTARRLVRHYDISALAIDGPGHGERRSESGEEMGPGEFEKAWQRPEATDETIADWKVALDAVQAQVGVAPVGYFGLSMGTMMGLPLVAAEPRIRAALLGLMGVWGPNAQQLVAAAPEVSCPVRFLVQWDDEIVPRDTALELFDRLGCREKALRAHPGKHVEVPAAEMRALTDFLAGHLC